MNQQICRLFQLATLLSSCLFPLAVQAQVTPDNTLPDNSEVTSQGDKIQIDGGTTRGNNLFHSFQEFSVPNGREAMFNNADTIENILSRVTGGNESVINGGISANGSANVFLINPAGIIFGENAFLNVGGSFIGSTADSLMFPDDVEYNATDADNAPVLTINAPIGLGFREDPQPITNSSVFVLDSLLIGLSVPKDATLALIGGDLSFPGGILTTEGGRIELGSVGSNSNVSLTEIAQGWDVGYEGVENFRDLNLSGAAFVGGRGADTGDIEVQARNISLIEGSEVAVNTSGGKAGNLRVVATDSLAISGNGADIDGGEFESGIFNNVSDSASGADRTLTVTTNRLTLNRGGQINAITSGSGQGADIDLIAKEIFIGEPFVFAVDDFTRTGIFAQTNSLGDAGNITIETNRLNLNNGGTISTSTFGSGNAGDLQVNAIKSINLTGAIAKADSNNFIPSSLFANVEQKSSATGNAGNLTINTSTLRVLDGAQIGAFTRNKGNGGTVNINADKSILLSGFVPQAELGGLGFSSISILADRSFKDESGTIIPTTGNGGKLNLTTENLTIEDGATISAGTFSLGDGGDANLDLNRLIVRNGGEIRAASLIGTDPLDTQRGAGGTLNINAKESVEVTGTRNINGEQVNSSLLVVGESNGEAGNINLNSPSLEVSNDGSISAATVAGSGGNIDLQVDDTIRLQNDSLISAAATRGANGGNINLDTNFIIASPDGNNDILASAGQQGTGGNIQIDAESVFGIDARSQNSQTNDLDASGGVDGQVIINTPDTDITQGVIETPENLVEVERSVAQVCSNSSGLASNNLVVEGKGGVSPSPSEPLDSQTLLVDGKVANNQEQQQAQTSSTMQPLHTAAGEIMPARGLIKTASGKIILTAYPTENNQRVPQAKINCGS